MRIDKSVKMHIPKWHRKIPFAVVALGLMGLLVFTLSCSEEVSDQSTPSGNQTAELQGIVNGLEALEEVLISIDNRLDYPTPGGEQGAELTDIVSGLETVEAVLNSIESHLASIDSQLAQTPRQSERITGNEWRRTRDSASQAMRAVINALAECRSEGGYDVNDDGGAQVREWLKEAAWREATIYPDRYNVSYWANLLPLFHCSTTDIEY